MAVAPSVSFSSQFQGASPIDAKTPIHFAVGLVAGLSGMSASWATVTVLAFEALLVVLEDESLGAAFEKRSHQSYGNQLVDTMAGIAGVYYGELLQKRQQMAAASPQMINTTMPVLQTSEIAGLGNVRWYR